MNGIVAYKYGQGLPPAVAIKLKPTSEVLSDEDLLKRMSAWCDTNTKRKC